MEPQEPSGSRPQAVNGHGPASTMPRARPHHLHIRLSDELYLDLKERAREQHRSMQGQVLRLIETDVRRAKKEPAP